MSLNKKKISAVVIFDLVGNRVIHTHKVPSRHVFLLRMKKKFRLLSKRITLHFFVKFGHGMKKDI